MTLPVPDERPQRRAVAYGRANQASAHYRPLRKGRPLADPVATPSPTPRMAKVANRRRFVLFVVALLVATAFGTAIFGVVLANPAPMALAPQAPSREAPEPSIQPMPPTGQGVPIEHAPPITRKANTAPASRDGATAATAATAGRGGPASGAGGDAEVPVPPPPSPPFTYQNCNKAERAGALPLYSGEPGYSAKLDKDGNGIACDEKKNKNKG